MGNHYLPVWYQMQFYLILSRDFNHEIIVWNQWLLARISLIYWGDIHRESLLTVVITIVVSFNTGWGYQLRNHLAESKIISSWFQTKSLVYWVDINGKSLLTCVVSNAVSFITQQGFQWQNHCAESMIIGSDFKTESLIYWGDIHRKSLLTVMISMAVSFNTWWGSQLWYHYLVVLGIGIGNPGVFHSYPHLYPCPTIWVFTNLGVCSPCVGKVPKQTKIPHNGNASINWCCCAVLWG